MFKLMLVFRHPTDIVQFEDHYNNLLALIERMPHVQRRQVVHVVGSPSGTSPYYRILEVYYPNAILGQASLLSPIGQEAGAELAKFAAGLVELIFADVFEEQGGSTPRTSGVQQ